MYVLLRGQVSVYHDYGRGVTDALDEGGDAAVADSVAAIIGKEFREQLSAFVVTLKGNCRPYEGRLPLTSW